MALEIIDLFDGESILFTNYNDLKDLLNAVFEHFDESLYYSINNARVWIYMQKYDPDRQKLLKGFIIGWLARKDKK